MLSFVFGVAVARALTPAGRGHFALIQALNGLTFVVANIAVTRALIRHIGKGHLSVTEAARVAPAMALLSGLAGAALMMPLALSLRGAIFSGIEPIWIAAATLLATPLLLREYVSGPLIAAGRPTPIVLATGAQPLGAVMLLLPLIVFGLGGLSWVGLAWALGIVISGTIAFVLSIRSLQALPRLIQRKDFTLLRFGLRVYPAYITRFLNLRIDQFLVGWLASASELGYYAIAVTVGELLIQVPVVMLWALSGSIGSSGREKSGQLVMTFCRWSIIVLLANVIVIALATPVAIPWIFGEEYRPAVASVLLLLPGMVAYAPALMLGEYFIVQRGAPGKATLIAVVSLVVGTGLNLPLTPRLGAVGASIASSCSYIVMLLVAAWLFHRETGIRGMEMLRISRSDLRNMSQALRGIVRPQTRGAPPDDTEPGGYA